jgi:hypothetical protein
MRGTLTHVIADARLQAHLETAYGIGVTAVSTLDKGVVRVGRSDGPAWVARVFGPDRPLDVVQADAEILDNLARAGFPAERRAAPVSTVEDHTVLVTEFVDGDRPPQRARTYAILGALLGRLHARPATNVRPGGAWHHLCPQGSPADEIAAALAMLDSAQARAKAGEHAAYDAIRAHVADLDDAADLPHGFVHPDFVPANAIATGESLTIVDWAGSGRGPRLWSLGFLLWAAGHDLRLVDWVVSRYRRHITPERAELSRLDGAVAARPLLISTWKVCHGYQSAARLKAELPADRRRAAEIADRARAAFAAPPE